jgi:hypothetical protein
MKNAVGVWIDHKKAVIVTLAEGGDAIKRIPSNLEQEYLPPPGSRNGTLHFPGVQSERQFMGHLIRYYDEVISFLHGAETILLLGPGEVKGDLKKSIKSNGLSGQVEVIDTTEKMTDQQIAARVREYFVKTN